MLHDKLKPNEWEKARKHFNPKGSDMRDFCMSHIASNYDSYTQTGAMVFIEEAERIAKGRRLCDWLTFLKGV